MGIDPVTQHGYNTGPEPPGLTRNAASVWEIFSISLALITIIINIGFVVYVMGRLNALERAFETHGHTDSHVALPDED